MSKRGTLHRVGRIVKWILLSLVAIVILIPVLLYLPPIQDLARVIAIHEMEKSTGMDVSLEKVRLKFPIKVQLQGLCMKEQGDTLLAARNATLDVDILSLLKSRVEVSEANLDDALYRLNTPDSAVYLKAKINKFTTTKTNLTLNIENINVGKTVLDGADITLILKDTITAPTPEEDPTHMLINVPDVELRNVRFHMAMLPTIDTLDTEIGRARLGDGVLDMYNHTINVGSLTVDDVKARYLTPSAEFLASYVPPAIPDSVLIADSLAVSAPWTIRARHIGLTSPRALYATKGVKASPGFDPEYIEVSDVKISVDSFYNRGVAIKVPLTELSAHERSGLSLKATGVFAMDSLLMQASHFDIALADSRMYLDALLGIGDMMADPNLPVLLRAKGTLGLSDLLLAFPDMKPMIGGIAPTTNLDLRANLSGTTGKINVKDLSAAIPDILQLRADGSVSNPMDFENIGGHINIDGSLTNPSPLRSLLLAGISPSELSIAPMAIKGSVDYNPGRADAKLKVTSGNGRVALDGLWTQRSEGYDATLSVDKFPLQRFLPSLGVADLTADASVRGHGYDITKRSTSIDASVVLKSLTYDGKRFSDISLDASLDTCMLVARVNSANHDADLMADISAHLLPDGYEWDLSSTIHRVDLQALGMSETPMGGSGQLHSTGTLNPRTMAIDATLDVRNLDWTLDTDYLQACQISAYLNATDSLTHANLSTGDFDMKLYAATGIDSIMSSLTTVSDLVNKQIEKKNIDVCALQHSLPPLSLDIQSGANNMIAEYLYDASDIKYRNANIALRNDSLMSLHADVAGFVSGQTALDNISLDINQQGKFLVYKAAIDNKPGTMDDFAHVTLSGMLSDDKFSALFKQRNIQDKEGFNLGFNATMSDSTVTVQFVPLDPKIAYKDWTVNGDNFVSYDFNHQHLDANLQLRSQNSSLQLYTEHVAQDTLGIDHQEDVILKLNNINLADWLSISPYAPPINGDIDADMRFRWDEKQLTGHGLVALNELYYGRERVGSFNVDLDLANDAATGAIRANASLLIDSVKVITAVGKINDSTADEPFLLDFTMLHLPLRVVNPFLSKDVAQLSGMLNGRMDITGDIANPVFNGYINFDSTEVKVGMIGSSYRFSDTKIPVDSNIVQFNDFIISGLNANGLHLNGKVDAQHLSNIRIDLSAKARDMMIVNSSRPRGANIYGKAYIDLDADVRGNMQFIDVDAALNILAGTNVTYVMTDAQSALTSRKDDSMVRFVQFADTAQVIKADSIETPAMAMNIDANLKISDGSTINVDISSDGKNKASLNAVGNLTYSQSPMSTDGRLTGRVVINKGFVRYTPPMMSEKNFKFEEGSWINFTGDMLNPTLNIKAVDRLKANVTQEGQNSRLVNFDVILSVTNTVNNMNVAFDLTTTDDITIENELTSMSAEQRANQAMNMLLYNIYTGPGTKGNANISGNPLYQFLTSQVNSWAAQNIRGVDISFGIDQYDKTTDGASQTATSYSYRVSKTLFNDRFKIVIGGNYSTDADADENFEQNLINDISFEYMLNRSGSMYVKLFRHVGYESILEGEVTQTGVGFVMKRKVNSLRNIFRFGKRKASKKSN